MGADADAACGAAYGQRSEERVNSRNGYREREWDTPVGMIELAIFPGSGPPLRKPQPRRVVCTAPATLRRRVRRCVAGPCPESLRLVVRVYVFSWVPGITWSTVVW